MLRHVLCWVGGGSYNVFVRLQRTCMLRHDVTWVGFNGRVRLRHTRMLFMSCVVLGGGENVLVKTGRMLHKRTQV